MAVAFLSVSDLSPLGAATFTDTLNAAGADIAFAVYCLTSAEHVDSITWGAQSFELVEAVDNGAMRFEVWQLLSPPQSDTYLCTTLSGVVTCAGVLVRYSGVRHAEPITAQESQSNAVPAALTSSFPTNSHDAFIAFGATSGPVPAAVSGVPPATFVDTDAGLVVLDGATRYVIRAGHTYSPGGGTLTGGYLSSGAADPKCVFAFVLQYGAQPDHGTTAGETYIYGAESGSLELDDFDAHSPLVEAVINSLFTWRTAEAGDDVTARRGFWADAYDDDGFQLGSRLWVHGRGSRNWPTVNLLIDDAKAALQHLVDDGIVAELRVTGNPGTSPMHGAYLEIELVQPDERATTIRFADLWTNPMVVKEV